MQARSFAPFRHRAFLLVWLGALVSNVGTWMETTALSFYVADRSSVSASGLVAAAGFLPTAILSPVAGAWADRFDRRRIMICTNLTSMVIAGAVATLVASGHASAGNLALCSLAAGCTGAIGFPAFQATLPDLVPREDLVSAIGLSSMQWNLGRIIGPTLAAIAIALGGTSTALWVNACSFLAVVAAISFAKVPHRVGVRRPVLHAINDGIRFARHTPAVRAMIPIMIVVVFVVGPFIGFVAQMATNVLGMGQGGTSLLVTAQGVGAVIAGASMGALISRFSLRNVIVGAVLALVPALVLYGLAPNRWVAAFGLMCLGFAYMASLSSFTSVTQQSAPGELRGRAMAVNNLVMGSAFPFGLVLQGEIADRTSLRTVTVASGLVVGAVALAVWLLRPTFTRPLLSVGTPADAPDLAAPVQDAPVPVHDV